MGATWLLLAVQPGCGGRWAGGDTPHEGVTELDCDHAVANCDSCHPVDEPLGAVDDACLSCHLDDRPASHDPELTAACNDCHSAELYVTGLVHEDCDWEGVSPHPSGFREPEAHGIDANLQGPAEGDCRDCHGAALEGGVSPEGANAQGCDDCHTQSGHEDWRTDCTFCHGGEDNVTGAPPHDIDGTAEAGLTTFPSHSAHVTDSGDYRVSDCIECHPSQVTGALDPEHWFDATPAVSEVGFDRGIAPATVWSGTTCADNYCHGQGVRNDGEVSNDAAPMNCESCHATEAGWSMMSGFHAAHLDIASDPIVCNDCHAAVIDRAGAIDSPGRHVDGVLDISFIDKGVTRDGITGTCDGDCHGAGHDATGWGHPPGYAAPELHGLDANLQASNCRACHGGDLRGGSAIGCDNCHTKESHADWRTDCTFCHGGTVDSSGAPPEDIDNTVDTISFVAHPAHEGAGSGAIGHPDYDCSECHAVYTDVLDFGHAIDGSPARGEVDFAGGWASEGGYDPGSSTCSNLSCHGNGQTPSGVVADGPGPLDCDACHATTTAWETMSQTHATHLAVKDVTCASCHAPVVDDSNHVVEPDLHVNREVTIDLASTGWTAATVTCTVECHGTEHRAWAWPGGHAPGFEDGDEHGPEALLRLQDCHACHGADLTGDSASGCDDCHTKEGHSDWRADCVFCHGGESGDTAGVPPRDIDGNTSEASISFKSHPEHATTVMSGDIACETCHDGAQNYVEAVSDSGHWLTDDTTAQVGEVVFAGLASGTNYASSTCSDSYCHGNGQVAGSLTDSTVAVTCDSCHSYAFDHLDLTGTHELHLGVTTPSAVTCADCHGAVVDTTGAMVDRMLHVNGDADVDATTTVGWDAANDTCTNSCHGHTHDASPWEGGHAKGYDAAAEHGTDALLQTSSCSNGACHGTDLQGGGSGTGCDSCHSSGWRSDCAYCHGGANGDTTGIPPEDLDNTTNPADITFVSHDTHVTGDDHKALDCEDCHGAASASYNDAHTDTDHWWDDTPGLSEVDFAGGIATGGGYTAKTSTCTENYCHGSGLVAADIVDSSTPLGCADCHAIPPDLKTGTEGHTDHGHDTVSCEWCHDSVAASSSAIDGPTLHVDGSVQVSFSSDATQWGGIAYSKILDSCVGECHADGTSRVHILGADFWQ